MMLILTCCVKVFRVVVAPASGAVVPEHQSNCEEHKKEAKSNHDAIAAALV